MMPSITAFCLGYVFRALTYKHATETDRPNWKPRPKWFWRIFIENYDEK